MRRTVGHIVDAAAIILGNLQHATHEVADMDDRQFLISCSEMRGVAVRHESEKREDALLVTWAVNNGWANDGVPQTGFLDYLFGGELGLPVKTQRARRIGLVDRLLAFHRTGCGNAGTENQMGAGRDLVHCVDDSSRSIRIDAGVSLV